MASFKASWLLYGATGYSGGLIAEAARAAGHNVVLGGRDEGRLKPLAERLGVKYRCFDMAAPRDAVDRALTGVRLVLNAAGPFSLTAPTLAQACMRTGTHYLDLAGEVPEHRGLHRLDERAREAGVMLLPGVGFGILPSDCLAMLLKERMPNAVTLDLGFLSTAGASRGTLHTLMESLLQPGFVWQRGQLSAAEAASDHHDFDFGPGGTRRALLFPWRADSFSAGLSTGIPFVRSYAAVPWPLQWVLKQRAWFAEGLPRRLLERYAARAPLGPDANTRNTARSYIAGEVVNEVGQKVRALLELPEAYEYTVRAALYAVDQVLAGHAPEGFRTPAQVFGSQAVGAVSGAKLSFLT